MTEKITIEPMSNSDIEEVIKIDFGTKQLQIDDANNIYYEPAVIRRALSSHSEICLVAKEGAQLAGYLIAHLNEVFGEVYISDIALKPEYRGRGIGQMLMSEARKMLEYRDVDWSWALVQEDNMPMHSFMEKQGYKKGKGFYFFYKPSGF